MSDHENDPARGLPTSPEKLFETLKELGIETRTTQHPALHTVEESRALRGEIPGGHIKNLFLRDKKKNVFLLVAEEDAVIDLKTIHARIGGSGRGFLRKARTADAAARRAARVGHTVRADKRHRGPRHMCPARKPHAARCAQLPSAGEHDDDVDRAR